MQYVQYMRKYSVLVVSAKTSVGTEFNNLRCAFKVEKALKDTPNFAQIVITNPSPAAIAAIEDGDTVILQAGYENGNYGMIYSGQIVQIVQARDEGVDLHLTLVCQDGDALLTGSFTAKTLSAGSTVQDVIAACADEEETGYINPAMASKTYIRGKTVFGKSADTLREVADGSQCQFYVEDGKVNIVAAEDVAEGMAYELSPETGLVGDTKQTDDGISAQCLLNPSIKLNSWVYIREQYIEKSIVSNQEALNKLPKEAPTGAYRIIKLTYEGDTHGEDWYCTFDAVTQPEEQPTYMKEPTKPKDANGDNKSTLYEGRVEGKGLLGWLKDGLNLLAGTNKGNPFK